MNGWKFTFTTFWRHSFGTLAIILICIWSTGLFDANYLCERENCINNKKIIIFLAIIRFHGFACETTIGTFNKWMKMCIKSMTMQQKNFNFTVSFFAIFTYFLQLLGYFNIIKDVLYLFVAISSFANILELWKLKKTQKQMHFVSADFPPQVIVKSY